MGWTPLNYIWTGLDWAHIETRPTDPYAARVSEDYIEFSNRVFVGVDTFTCWAMTGFSLANWFGENCGFGEVQVRHSFKKITTDTDFLPRYYPDSIVRKDASGEASVDAESGEVVREGIYERFGVFRLGTPTYDRGYGFTESGRLQRAMLFNIWENSTDAAGAPLPYAERQEKPIIYYLNTEYPPRYREVAAEVGSEYNRVFKAMVADLKGVDESEVMDMFEVRTNDCNEANIVSYVMNRPELTFAVGRATCSDLNPSCELPITPGGRGTEVCTEGDCAGADREVLQRTLEQKIGIGNLTRVCTSLESATYDRETGKTDFNWQRVGDLRYNFIVWLANPQDSGWGGYGPMHADALTGETIAATSYIRGVYYEIGAANVADYICFMNDEEDCSITEIAYGQSIRRDVAGAREDYLRLTQNRASTAMTNELRRRVKSAIRSEADAIPVDESGRSNQNRLARIAGTNIEKTLLTEEWEALLTGGTWLPHDGAKPRWIQEANLSLTDLYDHYSPFSPVQEEARQRMNAGGYCFLTQDLDPHWAGLALDLADLSRDERIRIIANRLVKHVILHEVGHNVGLAHNFEGSYDALNYKKQFWEILGTGTENEVANNLDEYRHTTVMEYMSSKGLFADELGNYDEAALRFAYGNQVQVLTSPNLDPNLEGGEALEAWRYYNDYRKIPDYLCGGQCPNRDVAVEVVSMRDWVDFDPQNPPRNEVPYLFCDNFLNFRTPFCAVFDYGSSLSEVQANNYNMWRYYYFFNSFARDRLSPYGWSFGQSLRPIQLILNTMDVTTQYFYILEATDPEFQGTDLEEDMISVMLQSMNIATEIMGVPQPDRYCPLQFQGQSVPTYFTSFTASANGRPCDRELPITSPQMQASLAIDVNLGNGRPLGIGLSRDLEDRQVDYIGSVFDKQLIGLFIGSTSPRLFRFNYDLDIRNFFISSYRIFEPELRQFYRNLFVLDGFLSPRVAENLASFWCRDPAAPDRADLGYLEPRRMFDLAATEFASFPPASDACLEPAQIYPAFTLNLPEFSMLAAHVFLSSDFDERLDFGQDMRIYVKGAYDDPAAFSALPNCADPGPKGKTASAPTSTACARRTSRLPRSAVWSTEL
ncbi:MAG: hypothetical protein HC923_00880 [Myxococcales bacterium]|nr:hypothetical protein [Myxococcales bacterium]